MKSTLLSTILSRMDRWHTIYNIEEQDKVRDLDEALRTLSREIQTPWKIKKSTLRVFDEVLEYPIASDHDYILYLDNVNTGTNGQNSNNLLSPANFYFTSLKEFYENPDYRNDLAEIWDGGTKYLGVRYSNFNAGSATFDSAGDVTHYTASGDASIPTLDNVFYKDGNSSIKFTVTQNTNVATMSIVPGVYSDQNYKQKYFFVYVYLGGIPASIDLRFGLDSSNYLTKNVTTQFSGQAFKANDWNLLAIDLNDPDSTVGAISTTNFNYSAVILNTAPTGTYYINLSYVKPWTLMDYWYYSTYNVALTGSSTPNQEYFNNDSEVYALDSSLVGDKEWADVAMYDAILTGITDSENLTILGKINEKRENAWQKLKDTYPSEKPLIMNRKYNFGTDYTNPYNNL